MSHYSFLDVGNTLHDIDTEKIVTASYYFDSTTAFNDGRGETIDNVWVLSVIFDNGSMVSYPMPSVQGLRSVHMFIAGCIGYTDSQLDDLIILFNKMVDARSEGKSRGS